LEPPVAAPKSRYQALDAVKIVSTARKLHQRIRQRFPESNLGRVAEELVMAGEESRVLAASLARPIWWLRGLTFASIAILVIVFISTLAVFRGNVALFSSVADYLQGLDAAVNELIFFSLAVFFLFTLETRVKRRRALKELHALRSMAHIIDMHQLTKDPERFSETDADEPAPAEGALSALELTRYLDYCSEMLAVISKLAALHVQEFSDPVTLSAVNDIEDLTQGLSRKIWQKIMILDRILAAD
jgi:hypothetical protein